MSRPRQTKPREALGLVVLGLGTALSLSPLLRRDYFQPRYELSFWALMAACIIYPACILGFARKNIAHKNGDWHILLFIILANYGLFWLVSTQR
jgi:hypothetical protein